MLTSLIKRNTKLRHDIAEVRRQMLTVDSQLDLIKIRAGDMQITEVVDEYRAELELVREDFERLEKRGQTLMTNCKEYEQHASDEDEVEKITEAEAQIAAFIKTCSSKQTASITKDLERLGKMCKEFELALNKDDVREDIMKMIKTVEDKLTTCKQTLENQWLTLSKKTASFEDFDLNHKVKKRQQAYSSG